MVALNGQGYLVRSPKVAVGAGRRRSQGPVARDRALSAGRPLHQAQPGLYENAQIAAMMERLETREFRRMQLELLSR